MNRLVPALLFVVLTPGFASAQAWTRDTGDAYLNLSLSFLSSDQMFGSDFETRQLASDYSQTTLGLYAEIGLIDRWLTTSVSAELFRRNALADQGATQGLGDLRVGFWSGLVTAPFRLTAGVLVGLPTGDDSPEAPAGSDTDSILTAASLPTGDGEFDLEPTVIIGDSFGGPGSAWPLRHFATVRAGYWLRTKGFTDAFTYQLELGTQVPGGFWERFWLITRLRGVESFAGGSAVETGFAGLGDGVTYTTVSVELAARVWNALGAAISYDTSFRARGLIAAAPIKLAISIDL